MHKHTHTLRQVMEVVGPSWRGRSGMLAQTFYILGEFVLVGLVAALRHLGWRWLVASGALLPLGGLAIMRLVPESPR